MATLDRDLFFARGAIALDLLALGVHPLHVSGLALVDKSGNLRGDLVSCVDNFLVNGQLSLLRLTDNSEVHVGPRVADILPQLRDVHDVVGLAEHWCQVGRVSRLDLPVAVLVLHLHELVEVATIEILLVEAGVVLALIVCVGNDSLGNVLRVVLQELLLLLDPLRTIEILQLLKGLHALAGKNGRGDTSLFFAHKVLTRGHREGDGAALSTAGLPPDTAGDGAAVSGIERGTGWHAQRIDVVTILVAFLGVHQIRRQLVHENARVLEGLRHVGPHASATIGLVHETRLNTRGLAQGNELTASGTNLIRGDPHADTHLVRLAVELVDLAVAVGPVGVVEDEGALAAAGSTLNIGGLSLVHRGDGVVLIHPLGVDRVTRQNLGVVAHRGERAGGRRKQASADHATVIVTTIIFYELVITQLIHLGDFAGGNAVGINRGTLSSSIGSCLLGARNCRLNW